MIDIGPISLRSVVCRASMENSDICNDRKIDILSHLPDPIRVHVLSFLPMKDAIRTKNLSRRWRHTCSSLSKLEFRHNEFKDLRDFKDFVDNTLIVHDGSDVLNFTLSFTVDDELISANHLNAWIIFAIQHNVERLELNIWGMLEKHGRLPLCFFTCNTLSVLSLYKCDNLKWPTFIKFPMLKDLELNGVTFNDENVTAKLFSSAACPVLQKLSIYSCHFKKIHILSISFPSLKHLQLLCEDAVNVDLSVPVLLEIDYECLSPPKISYETLSSMLHACFQFSLPDTLSRELAFRDTARKILTGLCNVESLNFSYDIIEILARDPDLLAYFPTSYHSLKHLHVNIMSTKSHVESIACLLRTSPNLQTLGISCWEDSASTIVNHRQGYWDSHKLSIADGLKNLKSVDIEYFLGRESEMDIVRRLLESASVLEKMNIQFERICEAEHYEENRMKSSEKLSSFKRVSPRATIIFS